MLQLQVLREETDRVLDGLAKRNFKDAEELVLKALELDKSKRSIQTDTQERETQSNQD
jgi:seryl-tRNA synthetase